MWKIGCDHHKVAIAGQSCKSVPCAENDQCVAGTKWNLTDLRRFMIFRGDKAQRFFAAVDGQHAGTVGLAKDYVMRTFPDQ